MVNGSLTRAQLRATKRTTILARHTGAVMSEPAAAPLAPFALRRARLRALLAGADCVHPASTWDPISARIAQETGFECGMLAGSVAALAVLGAPDVILLTLSEFAETARRVLRACDLPIIADADHGYGNALNVMRTVEELESAGVAGLTIEDTALPRPFGEASMTLISRAEAVGKAKAALAARTDAGLCVFGRTGALSLTGLADAIDRLKAYEDVGVDGVFLTGATQRSEIEALAKAARGPLLLGGVSKDLLDRPFLAAHGVRIALQGHQPIAAATAAIEATMRALRAGSDLPPLASPQRMDALSAGPLWRARTQAFLD
jgi:carboxyvinyl-carboxyphosphonate phosphorylmutase